MENKAKVYQGVVCLEIDSAYGAKWWMQTPNNSYTPVLVEEIRVLRHGVLRGSNQPVLAAPLRLNGQDQLIAINMARSDIAALKKRRLWPGGMKEPFTSYNYTEWPVGFTRRDISLK